MTVQYAVELLWLSSQFWLVRLRLTVSYAQLGYERLGLVSLGYVNDYRVQ